MPLAPIPIISIHQPFVLTSLFSLHHLIPLLFFFFFFMNPAPPEIYTLPLHAALPICREAAGIGRATVYRTLQWMVGAGIARKVDFGEGRSRFEPSSRPPRHFHLICTTCHSSSEFLSSDVESLMEEVAAARHFIAAQAVV